MAKHISATKAVRDFSELLKKIRFKGDHYIIERSGKPVAMMEPVKDVKNTGTLKELKFLLKELPPLGDELEAFAGDLEDIWRAQPPFPEEGTWE